ncbi:MAG: outer membrane beta-barrel protein, partial [Limisphaerales bacterium]
AASARAQDRWHDPLNGFYANAGVGVNILGDIKASLGGAESKVDTHVGERISLSVGYMVPLASKTSVGLEFETGAIVNTLDKRTITSGGITTTDELTGYYYQLPFLVNGLLVCHAVPRWTFFGGIGGGGVYSRLHFHRINDVEVDADAEETDAAFQAMGGARYQLNPWSEVGIAYKYLAVFVKDTDTVNNHAVVATYTFHF